MRRNSGRTYPDRSTLRPPSPRPRPTLPDGSTPPGLEPRAGSGALTGWWLDGRPSHDSLCAERRRRAGLPGARRRAHRPGAGIAVHIGARVGALAGASEVWVSSTVRDLTAGSGLTFEDAGEHELKGVPDRWHLYRVLA